MSKKTADDRDTVEDPPREVNKHGVPVADGPPDQAPADNSSQGRYHGYTDAQVARIEAEKDQRLPQPSAESEAVQPGTRSNSTTPAGRLSSMTRPPGREQKRRPNMTVTSINEPQASRAVMLTPQSINEPTELPDFGGFPPVTPVLTSLTPDTAVIGGADVTMKVSGTGFTPASVITFNGGDEPTSFTSPTEVSTGVKPSTATTPGAYPVTVRNGDLDSGQLSFTFTAAEPEAEATWGADPDELEDEIEQAREDGEFVPTHKSVTVKKTTVKVRK